MAAPTTGASMDDSNTIEISKAARPHFVSEKVIAPLLSVSIQFLQKDRRTAKTIPFVKLGDRCLYEPEAVLAAVRARTVGGEVPSGSRSSRKPRNQR
jgi:hypothetical protein